MDKLCEPALEAEVLIERDRAVIQMLFNRPQALNALNDAMRAIMADIFTGFARDPELYALVIRSTDLQSFCSGTDFIELSQLARHSLDDGRASLAKIYKLSWLAECFSKPTAVLIEGAIIGAGAGLMQSCTHRVAAETYEFSMPETSLGMFPDAGMARVLAGLPHQVGFYLALTGRTIGRADAYALGLVTHCIAGAEFENIILELADAQPIDPLLDSRHEVLQTGELEAHYACISDVFAAPTVSEVMSRLQDQKAGYHAPEWIDGVIRDLSLRSPTALAITHRHLQFCRGLGLRENLIRDYALSCQLLEHKDFYAGIDARRTGENYEPDCEPASLPEIEDEVLARFFSRTHNAELELAGRADMQPASG